jgi:hypothetical protein
LLCSVLFCCAESERTEEEEDHHQRWPSLADHIQNVRGLAFAGARDLSTLKAKRYTARSLDRKAHPPIKIIGRDLPMAELAFYPVLSHVFQTESLLCSTQKYNTWDAATKIPAAVQR